MEYSSPYPSSENLAEDLAADPYVSILFNIGIKDNILRVPTNDSLYILCRGFDIRLSATKLFFHDYSKFCVAFLEYTSLYVFICRVESHKMHRQINTYRFSLNK